MSMCRTYSMALSFI